MSDDATLPAPGPEHERLRVFLGKWHAEGASFGAGPDAPEPWVSDEIFEMVPGGFFLVQRWDARTGSKLFRGIGMVGYDAKSGAYVNDAFDSLGFHQVYKTTVEGDVWTFTGKTERARVEFTDGGDTQVITWEWKPGRTWVPLCERTARRVGRVPSMGPSAPANEQAGEEPATPSEARAPRSGRARRRPGRPRPS